MIFAFWCIFYMGFLFLKKKTIFYEKIVRENSTSNLKRRKYVNTIKLIDFNLVENVILIIKRK